MDPRDVAAMLVEDAAPTSKEPEQKDEEQVTSAEHDEADEEPVEASVEEDQVETEDEPDEADPEEETVDTFTFKVDGEEVEVTVDELVKSYQIDNAAKKRLQEATEARKVAVEEGRQEGLKYAQSEISSAKQEIETARQQLAEMAGFLGEDVFSPRVPEPDPAMEETDPVGFSIAWRKYEQDQKRIAEKKQQIQAFAQQTEAARREQHRRLMKENQVQLLSKRPELREPEAQKVFTENVRRAQEFAGFTSEEVNNFPDYRGVMALDKLGALLAQMEGPTPAQKVVAKAKKPLEPGAVTYKRTQRQKQRRADRDRAAKTGDYRDVAKLLVQDAPRKR